MSLKLNIQDDNQKALLELINSEEFIESSNKLYRSQLILAQMNEIIAKKQLKQEELAKRMNMSQPNLNMILNGKKPKFTLDTVLRFCEATGVKLAFV